jgi:type I restriction enzyme S subunit
MTTTELLAEIKTRLQAVHGPRLRGVILFGSEARGQATPDSDVDILVLLDDPVDFGEDLERNIHALYPLTLKFGRPISPIPASATKYETYDCPLYRNIHREGIVELAVRDGRSSPPPQHPSGRKCPMMVFAEGQWQQAKRSVASARLLAGTDPNTAASAAYYAAFHAVTALFALRDQSFVKHTALRAAVHRDLVKPGILPKDVGDGFDFLMEARGVADYGDANPVTTEKAMEAVETAEYIVETIGRLFPELDKGVKES